MAEQLPQQLEYHRNINEYEYYTNDRALHKQKNMTTVKNGCFNPEKMLEMRPKILLKFINI